MLALVARAGRASATTTSLVVALGNGGGLIVPLRLGVLLTRYGPLAISGMVLVAALIMLALCAAMRCTSAAAARVGRTCENPL